MITAIDVCCGAGGWAVAARGLPIRIVAAFDREPRCLDTYSLNHPATATYLGDVRTFNFRPWAGVDLVLGGIPCEQVSVVRAMRPASRDEISGLHEVLDRCLSLPGELGAEHWCFEDTGGITRHLPLLTPWFELNARHFSGQARKRVYVGTLARPPLRRDARVLRDYLRPGLHRANRSLFVRDAATAFTFRADRFMGWREHRKSLTLAGLGSRHDNHAAVPCAGPCEWRHLEWQEAARLQGFPDDYVFCGAMEMVWKQVGQAVQIDAARAILEHFVETKGRVREGEER